MTNDTRQLWRDKALEGRKLALGSLHAAGSGHLGGIMSVMDALVVLYYSVLRVDPANPRRPDRDRLVMSKGHAGVGLYTVLAMKGFFPMEWLQTVNKPSTRLPSHCDMNKVPGVDMTCGSLGQGASAAVGMAVGAAMDGNGVKVYCIVGDGECQEGQVWEAVMLAAQLRLDRLFFLVDNNRAQVDGFTGEVNRVEPLDDKFRAFGWDVRAVDGHDHQAIFDAITAALAVAGLPHAIILDTKKAKGVINYEGTAACHTLAVNDEVYATILGGLEGERE